MLSLNNAGVNDFIRIPLEVKSIASWGGVHAMGMDDCKYVAVCRVRLWRGRIQFGRSTKPFAVR